MNYNAFYCLVCGSRTFDNYPLLRDKLDKILSHKQNVVIVSGGAYGADSLAERYAKERNYKLKVFLPNWVVNGRKDNQAGYKRNAEMIKFIQQYTPECGVVAFWKNKSNGTAHTIGLSERYNIPVRIITV